MGQVKGLDPAILLLVMGRGMLVLRPDMGTSVLLVVLGRVDITLDPLVLLKVPEYISLSEGHLVVFLFFTPGVSSLTPGIAVTAATTSGLEVAVGHSTQVWVATLVVGEGSTPLGSNSSTRR